MNRFENLKGMFLLAVCVVGVLGLLLWQKIMGPDPYPDEADETGAGEAQDPRIPS